MGTKAASPPLGTTWPGFSRAAITRNLSSEQVKRSVAMNAAQLQQYGAYGAIISDDNQLLAYGKALYAKGVLEENFALLHHINNQILVPTMSHHFR